MFRKEGLILIYGPPFLFQVFANGPRQTGVGKMVQAVGFLRQITSRQLVLPLCARLNPLQFMLNGKVYGLIITGFKMQKIMVFDCAPVAPIERFGADEIQMPRQ